LNNLLEQLEECEALLIDGYDEALIGIGGAFNQLAAVYDRQKILDKLVSEGLTVEEADEHISYNIEGAFVGERTPIIVEIGCL
jgi:hypothetical protein